jgi:hypothetical protein
MGSKKPVVKKESTTTSKLKPSKDVGKAGKNAQKPSAAVKKTHVITPKTHISKAPLPNK